ncbi:hypothetical protein [Neobacillus niacini]|uniref:hypothetical protein n=1 Tax=Neobacillus niacini TaxID=86668 RepID=UPI000A5FE3BD|nr:hypothetical protein [Neobacillus niacini]
MISLIDNPGLLLVIALVDMVRLLVEVLSNKEVDKLKLISLATNFARHLQLD